MSTESALWLILGAQLASLAMGAPLALAFAEEFRKAKRDNAHFAPLGCVSVIIQAATLCLWWWYALATDQILLAVIPTVAFVWARMAQGLIRLAGKP